METQQDSPVWSDSSCSACPVTTRNWLGLASSGMCFFNATPLGRIVNRFTKDMYDGDQMIARFSGLFLSSALRLLQA